VTLPQYLLRMIRLWDAVAVYLQRWKDLCEIASAPDSLDLIVTIGIEW